jgi:ubiquinone/menaquinone biosynthesis C-methylase UbiE
MGNQASVGDRYVLETGELGAKRLSLLNQVYGDATRSLLGTAGVAAGSHVVDFGCGTGNVSMEIAKLVGANGSVTGVDASPDQLAIGRSQATTNGLTNVKFVESSVYGTSLPESHFDFAYARLILCHLQRPLDALREMLRILKPGGTLICEDLDISSLQTYPITTAYQRVVELSLQLADQRQVSYCRGRELPSLLVSLGYSPTVRVFQPAFLQGEVKRVWEYTFLEASPNIVEAGLATQNEIDSLADELSRIALDASITVYLSRFVQCWIMKSTTWRNPTQ